MSKIWAYYQDLMYFDELEKLEMSEKDWPVCESHNKKAMDICSSNDCPQKFICHRLECMQAHSHSLRSISYYSLSQRVKAINLFRHDVFKKAEEEVEAFFEKHVEKMLKLVENHKTQVLDLVRHYRD
jgi:hypothetical protein